MAAARVFSMLCSVAEKAQPYSFGGACLVSDDIQVCYLLLRIFIFASTDFIR